MFLDELTPIFRELTGQPIAFTGGFVAGILRLKLSDEPIQSWLSRQAGTTTPTASGTEVNNGRSSPPQSITID